MEDKKMIVKKMDEGNYSISSNGDIISFIRINKKLMTPKKEPNRDDIRYQLLKDGVKKTYSLLFLMDKYFPKQKAVIREIKMQQFDLGDCPYQINTFVSKYDIDENDIISFTKDGNSITLFYKGENP